MVFVTKNSHDTPYRYPKSTEPMNVNDFIKQTQSVFNNRGDHCDFGCSQNSILCVIEYIKEHLPHYQYCVISNWRWIDIDASEEAKKKLKARGLKPCFLYSDSVDEDEKNRGFKSVRTTFLKSFHKNCIFLTKNTAYFLQGSGTRMTIDAAVFASIFFD